MLARDTKTVVEAAQPALAADALRRREIGCILETDLVPTALSLSMARR
jgi:hypothetical protein